MYDFVSSTHRFQLHASSLFELNYDVNDTQAETSEAEWGLED